MNVFKVVLLEWYSSTVATIRITRNCTLVDFVIVFISLEDYACFTAKCYKYNSS